MEELMAVWLFSLSLILPPAAVAAGALWLLIPKPGRRAVTKEAPPSALPIAH